MLSFFCVIFRVVICVLAVCSCINLLLVTDTKDAVISSTVSVHTDNIVDPCLDNGGEICTDFVADLAGLQ